MSYKAQVLDRLATAREPEGETKGEAANREDIFPIGRCLSFMHVRWGFQPSSIGVSGHSARDTA